MIKNPIAKKKKKPSCTPCSGRVSLPVSLPCLSGAAPQVNCRGSQPNCRGPPLGSASGVPPHGHLLLAPLQSHRLHLREANGGSARATSARATRPQLAGRGPPARPLLVCPGVVWATALLCLGILLRPGDGGPGWGRAASKVPGQDGDRRWRRDLNSDLSGAPVKMRD